MQNLGLRRTRCMCDVSATYLWCLHDECAAHCNDQNNTTFNRIRSAIVQELISVRALVFDLAHLTCQEEV